MLTFMRIRLASLIITIATLVAVSACAAVETRTIRLSENVENGVQFMRVRLLGALQLPERLENGASIEELSGLAWDEDEQLLYAVSDQGMLVHMQPVFSNGQLKTLNLLGTRKIGDEKGAPLPDGINDTEGLAILNERNGQKGDSELIISFEGEPRINRYSPQGTRLGSYKVPTPIHPKSMKGGNTGLESVTLHPDFGIITAPEKPLTSAPQDLVTLYGDNNRQWRIPAIAYKGGAVVALETLPDKSLLLLERRINSPLEPMIITLRKAWLTEACSKPQNLCKTEDIATFNSIHGWALDNFEGLARHQGNRFFMVSDNNQFWMQRTLLVYFEITN